MYFLKYSGGSEYLTSEYQNHLNTEQIERTGFQMVEAFSATILLQPSEYRSGFQMVTILTTTYSSPDQFVRYSNGPVIRCPVPAKIDHSN
jgi:hypothetical protein